MKLMHLSNLMQQLSVSMDEDMTRCEELVKSLEKQKLVIREHEKSMSMDKDMTRCEELVKTIEKQELVIKEHEKSIKQLEEHLANDKAR